MFGKEEFSTALKAYERETSLKGSDDFTSLRNNNDFFADIRDKEKMESQVRLFIDLISNMGHDVYANRFVIQTFLMEFCRYLDTDFLFTITDGRSFFKIKEGLKNFTGEIYESHKRFTQCVGLNSLEHLLENYGSLLKFADFKGTKQKEEEEAPSSFGDFLSGEKLW
jgi:hypothetical protein